MIHARYFSWSPYTLVLFLLCANSIKAGDWDITPRLIVGGGYSDNIFLVDDNAEGGWIGEVTPGINLSGESARMSAYLDYQLQNVFFPNNSEGNSSYNQLTASGTAELSKDVFFVDATANAGQAVLTANRPVPVGNLNISGNRTDFFTYSISPYIQSHLGGYADATLRYLYSDVLYSDSGVSDATINEVDALFVSGHNLKQASWFAHYNYRDVDRDTASNVIYENADGEARWGLSKQFSLVAQAGYANNDNVGRNNVNGPYWAAGAGWQPSRFYSLEALTGKNLTTATIGLYPTVRTSLLAEYRDIQVGINPGPKWRWLLNHYTRRTTWNLSYFEETTTVQQLTSQTEDTIFGVDPITGEPNPNPQPGDVIVNVPTETTTLTNDLFERKRASATFGMKTGRSGLRFTLWDERRESQETSDSEKTHGILGSWNRRLAPRTNSVLTASWQRITDDSDASDSDSYYWYVRAQLVRRIGPKTRGTIEYRHTEQEYPDTNQSGYTENLIYARLIKTF